MQSRNFFFELCDGWFSVTRRALKERTFEEMTGILRKLKGWLSQPNNKLG